MNRSMNLKGFLLILGVLLLVFLVLHSMLRSTINEKAETENRLRIQKTQLEEEYKRLTNQLGEVGTDEYILSSAVKDYSYVRQDAIRFEFTNPEALYAYTEEELQILMDEMND
jgi:hypothetical protein